MDNIANVSNADLAFLGDSVIEVLVREYLSVHPNGEVSSKRALEFVTAVNQSKALERILDIFTDEENDVFKRGRNSIHTHPKSASAAEYRRATGMECVFGYLWLTGQLDRARELFVIAYMLNV